MSEQQANNNFQIHKIYVKDLSLQVPEGTAIFQQGWKPELNLEVSNAAKALAEADTHEVVLTIKCNVTSNGKTAFVAEVQQAGIFGIQGLSAEDLKHALGAFCPNLLYPYAREAISDLVAKGGFPQLVLAPIDFNMMYEQHKAEQAKTN
jgi:preprotein translocase subunit SecB